MDLVIEEYEVKSRGDGARLIAALQENGYNVKLVIAYAGKTARIPELSYYAVWSDGTITRDDQPLDMDEVKVVNCSLRTWSPELPIKPLIKI